MSDPGAEVADKLRQFGESYLGVAGVLIPLAVSFYYTYIEAWCLGYTWAYLTGGIGQLVADYFMIQNLNKTALVYNSRAY